MVLEPRTDCPDFPVTGCDGNAHYSVRVSNDFRSVLEKVCLREEQTNEGGTTRFCIPSLNDFKGGIF